MIDKLERQAAYIFDVPFHAEGSKPISERALSVHIDLEDGESAIFSDQVLTGDLIDLNPSSNSVEVSLPNSYFLTHETIRGGYHHLAIRIFLDNELVGTEDHEFILARSGSNLYEWSTSFAPYTRLMGYATSLRMSCCCLLNAEREERENALIQAYSDILRAPIYITRSGVDISYKKIAQHFWDIHELQHMHENPWIDLGFDGLNAYELNDFMAAQIAQAEYLLGGSPHEEYRSNGIVQQSSGAAMTMWRAGKPVDIALCRDAVKVLKPYLRNGVRLGRN